MALRFKNSLYLLPWYRYLITRLRLIYFVHLRRRLKTIESDAAFPVTVAYNLSNLRLCSNRIELLLKPLAVIETVNQNSRALIIGPRNEHDLLALRGLGIDYVRGLDLISYSPDIELGDMHAMTYPDRSWDVVICGWTLSYSWQPSACAKELLRVTKSGGIIAVGVEYSTITEEDEAKVMGFVTHERSKLEKRINSVQEILAFFGDAVDHVYFSHDAPLRRCHSATGLRENPSNVAVVFSVK